MGNDDHRATELAQAIKHLALDCFIKRRGTFIEQQYRGT